jgi:predicted GNAT family acetyltransferase
MKKLAAEQGLLAFRPEVLDNGPAFGAFDGDRLVSMAATHFLTPEIAEIGNVVTAMDFRRRGLARTCTHALAGECFRTTERVFLMVVEENRFAYELYRGMGFRERGRFALVDASLKPGPIDKRE